MAKRKKKASIKKRPEDMGRLEFKQYVETREELARYYFLNGHQSLVRIMDGHHIFYIHDLRHSVLQRDGKWYVEEDGGKKRRKGPFTTLKKARDFFKKLVDKVELPEKKVKNPTGIASSGKKYPSYKLVHDTPVLVCDGESRRDWAEESIWTSGWIIRGETIVDIVEGEIIQNTSYGFAWIPMEGYTEKLK